MNTSTTRYENEVALIEANTSPVAGRVVHWLMSRKQVIYVLRELVLTQPASGRTRFPQAPYLEEMLPVVELETYFGMPVRDARAEKHYLVARAPKADGSLGRVIIPTSYPVRIRKAGFEAIPAGETGLMENHQDILGAFVLASNDLVILPDISAIIAKNEEKG